MADKLPRFATLQKFSARSNVVAIVQHLIGRIGQAVAQQDSNPAAAMDASGLAGSTASEYFRGRTGRRCNQWVKVSVARPTTLYADGGYDAEWIHQRRRAERGVESIIKPLNHRADGTRSGCWCSGMTPEHLREPEWADVGRRRGSSSA